jgi:hypothetical protein
VLLAGDRLDLVGQEGHTTRPRSGQNAPAPHLWGPDGRHPPSSS